MLEWLPFYARPIFLVYAVLYYADFCTNVAIMTFFYDSWIDAEHNTGWLMLIVVFFMIPVMGTVMYSIHPLDVFRLRVAVTALQSCTAGALMAHDTTTNICRILLIAETAPQLIVHVMWVASHGTNHGLSQGQVQTTENSIAIGASLLVVGTMHFLSLRDWGPREKLGSEGSDAGERRGVQFAVGAETTMKIKVCVLVVYACVRHLISHRKNNTTNELNQLTRQ